MHKIRTQVELWSQLQAIVLVGAMAGGTGSGLMALIIEELKTDMQNVSLISFVVAPSKNISNWVVEPYNFVFALARHIEYIDADIF